jgi:thiopeptide-type bacteriocin biosynthesis protein
MIDSLLDSFSYSDAYKLELLDILKTEYGREFGMSKTLKLQLDKRYREVRKDIEMIFKEAGEDDVKSMLVILKSAQEKLKFISADIINAINLNPMEIRLNELLKSLIHMTMNRLWLNDPRFHEMISYDFLHRHYESFVARKNKGVRS